MSLPQRPQPLSLMELQRQAAFARLWDKERGRIWRLTASLAGSADEADDLTQEVGMRALASFSQFRGLASPATWLHRIAVNVTLRHRERRRESTSLEGLELVGCVGPERQVFHAEELRQTHAAMDKLSEELRTPLVLHVWEGMSYKEIATVLKIPQGTVMSRLHAARQKLRKELSDAL